MNSSWKETFPTDKWANKRDRLPGYGSAATADADIWSDICKFTANAKF